VAVADIGRYSTEYGHGGRGGAIIAPPPPRLLRLAVVIRRGLLLRRAPPDVPGDERRPQHAFLPGLEIPLQIVVVVPQSQRRDAPRAAHPEGGVDESPHVVVVLVLPIAEAEDRVVDVAQELVRRSSSRFRDIAGLLLLLLSLLLLADLPIVVIVPPPPDRGRRPHLVYVEYPRLPLHDLHELLSVVRWLSLPVGRDEEHRPRPLPPVVFVIVVFASSSSSSCPVTWMGESRPDQRPLHVVFATVAAAAVVVVVGRGGAVRPLLRCVVVVVDDVLEVDDPVTQEPPGFGLVGDLPREHLRRARLGAVVDRQPPPGIFLEATTTTIDDDDGRRTTTANHIISGGRDIVAI